MSLDTPCRNAGTTGIAARARVGAGTGTGTGDSA